MRTSPTTGIRAVLNGYQAQLHHRQESRGPAIEKHRSQHLYSPSYKQMWHEYPPSCRMVFTALKTYGSHRCCLWLCILNENGVKDKRSAFHEGAFFSGLSWDPFPENISLANNILDGGAPCSNCEFYPVMTCDPTALPFTRYKQIPIIHLFMWTKTVIGLIEHTTMHLPTLDQFKKKKKEHFSPINNVYDVCRAAGVWRCLCFTVQSAE